MPDRAFVDTNVLIYAYDLDAGRKHDIAARAMASLWEEGGGVLSIQVLQEFYVNVTRKIPIPLSPVQARGVVGAYASWIAKTTGMETLLHASEIEERHQLSFWDSLIVASAHDAGADRILSEDFQPGQRIEGIVVENPFLDSGRQAPR